VCTVPPSGVMLRRQHSGQSGLTRCRRLSGAAVAVTHLARLAYVRKKYTKTALDKAHFDEF